MAGTDVLVVVGAIGVVLEAAFEVEETGLTVVVFTALELVETGAETRL
jgi:hypothetical protein